MGSLFSSKEGLPKDMGKAWQNLHVRIKEGRALAGLTFLPGGPSREDMNGEMETFWVGQPWEGFGSFGGPEYNFGHLLLMIRSSC